VDEDVKEAFERDIMNPTLEGLKAEGLQFAGVIFFGLMITSKGVYSLEYNMRMGDPETQAVLPLMENDFLDLILHALEGALDMVEVSWKKKSAVCVVMVAGGYPESYNKGDLIEGLDKVENQVFMAGVKNEDGFRTNGGRVLNLVALGDNLEVARKNAYEDIKKITFEKSYYRKDIGEVK
jgi:phosphoribosylamine--glycine ligase